MNNRRWTLVRFFLALVMALSLPGTVRANPQVASELYVYPGEGAPGAILNLSAFNLWPEISYQTKIEGDGLSGPVSLGTFFTDPNGTLTGEVTLPDLQAGAYTIFIDSADYNYPSTPFTVLPSPLLTLDPSAGPPGTVVDFMVSGLVAGNLRLDYASTPVLGPLAVGAGTFSGSFTVPADRPAHLGDPVQVDAISLVAGRVVARASFEFISQPAPAPISYQISTLSLPSSPVSPGQVFNLSGQISPPPTGALSDYNLKVLWKTAAGKVFPITSGTPSLQSDGTFQASAILPSLLNGDPEPAEQGGQVGVVFSKSKEPANAIS